MSEQYKLNENIVYIDQDGNIGKAEMMHIINLDDYTQEAGDAFRKLPLGDYEAFRKWCHKYGHRELGSNMGESIIDPVGFSTVATPALLDAIQRDVDWLFGAGYGILYPEESQN